MELFTSYATTTSTLSLIVKNIRRKKSLIFQENINNFLVVRILIHFFRIKHNSKILLSQYLPMFFGMKRLKSLLIFYHSNSFSGACRLLIQCELLWLSYINLFSQLGTHTHTRFHSHFIHDLRLVIEFFVK